jgi:hypothetical protein
VGAGYSAPFEAIDQYGATLHASAYADGRDAAAVLDLAADVALGVAELALTAGAATPVVAAQAAQAAQAAAKRGASGAARPVLGFADDTLTASRAGLQDVLAVARGLDHGARLRRGGSLPVAPNGGTLTTAATQRPRSSAISASVSLRSARSNTCTRWRSRSVRRPQKRPSSSPRCSSLSRTTCRFCSTLPPVNNVILTKPTTVKNFRHRPLATGDSGGKLFFGRS